MFARQIWDVQGSSLNISADDGCGVECSPDQLSFYIRTGEKNIAGPTICFEGKIIMSNDLKNFGRGLNFVVINGNSFEVKEVTSFDTYVDDGSVIRYLKKGIPDGGIVLVASFDEASSGVISENLNKGGRGFNVVTISHKTLKPVSVIHADTYTSDSTDLELYLEALNVGDIVVAVVSDDGAKKLSYSARDLLNNLGSGYIQNLRFRDVWFFIGQKGMDGFATMEQVMWDEKFPEHGELAQLFGFQNYSLPSSVNYTSKFVCFAIRFEEHFIVVEEELLLAPDFLSFLAQCFSAFNSDPTLLAVSAWNFNGFEMTSGNREIVYRVEDFPGLGFLVKKDALSTMVSFWDDCCSRRAWDGWRFRGDGHYEILMPDVSRVFRQPYQGAKRETELMMELFLKPRATSLQLPVPLKDLGSLMEKEYEEHLHKLIQSSSALSAGDLKQCVRSIEPPPDLPQDDKRPIAVYYEQTSSLDFRLLRDISRCFGLVSPRNYRPKNLHNGLLRFWYQDRPAFLIGSFTPYYKNKPTDVSSIKLRYNA
nr:hypothetical protein BaRGS_021555 [Batillaria attramentaria]